MAEPMDRMFVWRELMARDPAAAIRFYGELCNWTVKTVQMPTGPYHVLATPQGKQVAGVMALPPGITQSGWLSYVSVPNVDKCVDAAKRGGGKVAWGPGDIASVGRMATVVDPEGAMFAVLTESQPTKASRPEPGEFCWEQLMVKDVAGAKRFYGDVLGWSCFPFQGGGNVDVFGIKNEPGGQSASLMATPPGTPAHWMTYVMVPELAAGRERVRKLGGTVMTDTVEVPTVGSFAVVKDPHGAVFAIYQVG